MKKTMKIMIFAVCVGFGMNAMLATDVEAIPAKMKDAGRLIMQNGPDVLKAIQATPSNKYAKLKNSNLKSAVKTACSAAGRVTCGASPQFGAFAYLFCSNAKNCISAAKGKNTALMGRAETLRNGVIDGTKKIADVKSLLGF